MKKHVRAKRSFWKMGCLAAVSLVWLIIRTGRKPSRITYPCQKAAAANIHIFLLVLFAPVLDFGKFKTTLPHALNSRFTTTVLLVSSLLLAFGSVAITGNYISIENSFVLVPLDLQTHSAVTSVNPSNLFFVQKASGAGGNMDSAVSSLVRLMTDHGLSFFKTSSQPSGLIGKDDVVILKVNSQWTQRGGTNTDLVKSIINKIVNHPEGFTGEIIIADNGQWMARTDQNQWWTENNAYNHAQSMISVAQAFPSYKVSTWLWDIVRSISVNEYSQGDFNDGYVVDSTVNPVTHIQASWPKFKTKYSTYVSFKNGIWNTATTSYDTGKLKVINIPVLKSHDTFGVTGCIKHYMGVLTNSLTNGHGTIAYGSMGTVMAETRFPTLNILDAIWVNANPIEDGIGACGPDTSYAAASYTNVIGASQDPVALDYWASKHILIPAAIAKGYTAYSSLSPDYEPVTSPLTESFHNYLERSMYELKKNGFQVTRNEDEMNVYVWRAGATPDLNKDGIVNILDLTIVAIAFNSKPGNSNWNPTADLDGNGMVNIMDITIVAVEYGTTMTTIFEDGFESGGTSAWSWTTDTPAVVSDVQHHGTYSGKFSHEFCYVTKADLAHDTLYTRIYARIDTLPPSDKLVLVLRGGDSGGSVMYELYFYNNAGTLVISLSTKKPTGMRLDYKFAYSTNTWICLEVEYYRHAYNGEYRFWVNGVAAGSRTGLDTATGIGLQDRVVVGQVWSNYAVSVWVDCVTVSDAYIGTEASN